MFSYRNDYVNKLQIKMYSYFLGSFLYRIRRVPSTLDIRLILFKSTRNCINHSTLSRSELWFSYFNFLIYRIGTE